MKKRLGFLAIAVMGLNACSPTIYKSLQDPSMAWNFDYSAGACLGTCPNFEASLSESGTLHFKGKNFTQHQGDTILLNQSLLRDSVLAKLERMAFFQMDTFYGHEGLMDAAYYSFEINKLDQDSEGGGTNLKSVKANMEIPQELRDFQNWYHDELRQLGLL
ncbi:MAG: DUF6438 domain-containing protein [Bacteroidetes bacterium]|nr:DUF6438 domain-containing protein [Bacteroidota bacterium]